MIVTPFGEVKLGAFREVLAPPGRYFNDHCLFFHEGVWHFFGITGPIGGSCYGADSECSFAHATSSDLENWELHPDVLQVAGTWPDNHNVYAPHVIREGDTFYLFYTGSDDIRRQRVCLATSTDLFEWTRYAGNPVVVPSLFWAKWPGHDGEPEDAVGPCRDTHVMKLVDGRFVMYWVAELNARFGSGLSCVAASISEDLLHWQEIGPVFHMRSWEGYRTRSVESPCVVQKDGRYWLFFKHGWWTYVVVADAPWDFQGQVPVRLGFAHAAEVFEWEGRWFITHCSSDPEAYEYRRTRRRGLFLGELDWPEGGFPSLRGPGDETA